MPGHRPTNQADGHLADHRMDGAGRHRTTDGPVGPGCEGFLGVLSFLPDMHQTRDEQEEAAGCSLGKRPTGD